MTILVNIDGVVFNTQETLLKWTNESCATDYSVDDITSCDWFYTKFYSDPWTTMENEEFWQDVHVDDDAIDCILKWKHEGHTIKFITASYYYSALSFKIRRLLDYLNGDGEFDDEDVIVCHDKNMVRGDILIEDNFDNANIFSKIPNQYSILYSQPWNINQFLQTEQIGKMLPYDNWDGIDAGVQFINRLKK